MKVDLIHGALTAERADAHVLIVRSPDGTPLVIVQEISPDLIACYRAGEPEFAQALKIYGLGAVEFAAFRPLGLDEARARAT